MKDRCSNFELLRILCMILVVCGHFLLWSNTSFNSHELLGGTNYALIQFFRGFTVVAVNVFVLISGYWGIKLKLNKLIKINLMVLFYSLFFFFISIYLGKDILISTKSLTHFFPIISNKYWFITSYFILCLISPFINKFLKYINKKELELYLIVSSILFYLWPTVSYILNFDQVVKDAGYGVINFVILYTTGYYIRHYFQNHFSSLFWIIMYIVLCIILFLFQITYSNILGFSFTALYSYNTLFVYFASIALFMAFKQLQFKSNLINIISANCLSVYIIHMSRPFMGWIETIFKYSEMKGIMVIVHAIILSILIYLFCIIIEYLRKLICERLENYVVEKLHPLWDKNYPNLDV